MKKLLFPIFLLFFSSKCFSATGNETLQLCQIKNSLPCNMYIIGMLDGIDEQLARLAAPILDLRKKKFIDETLDELTPLILEASICRPEGMTYIQAKDIFINYLNNNPQERHKPSQLLFYNSLKMAFPCEQIKK